MTSNKPLQQLTLALILNPFLSQNNVPFATGNKRTANDMSCLLMSVILRVLKADALTSYTVAPIGLPNTRNGIISPDIAAYCCDHMSGSVKVHDILTANAHVPQSFVLLHWPIHLLIYMSIFFYYCAFAEITIVLCYLVKLQATRWLSRPFCAPV